ncbi:MAG: glycosyltransferase family 2 protein [Deltaproteobacteria bacterium]|nr:glycosyltransferase family 2 protein [Deltaproteobacteria bacterium]
MKLVIQIPCFNEAETLPATLAELPRRVDGFDEVVILVIDDGSTDGTSDVARTHGAHEVVRIPQNSGLAKAFSTGLDTALKLGADVIVNTDGDNQYSGKDIDKLVKPILNREAEMVIGDRHPDSISHFSHLKKRLQSLGSRMVRLVSGTRVPDATSGFRAFSKAAAAQINVLSDYTYTIETIIQAGRRKIPMAFVEVGTNPKTRDSRLVKSDLSYVRRSGMTILRFFAIYNPLKVFMILGGIVFAAGLALGLRYLFFVATGHGAGHVQSVVLSAALLIIGFQVFVLALIADLIGTNRLLLEDILARLRLMPGQGLQGSRDREKEEKEEKEKPGHDAGTPG